MKGIMAWMAAGLLLPVANVAAQTQPQTPEPKPEVKPEVNTAKPEAPKRESRAERQVEKAAFLGVAVAPASPSLRDQLGLPPGTGLLVLHVDVDSAANGKLQEHDLLTRFNDQILVNPEQLTSLVYNAGIGTEVKLTLIRKKVEETVSVVLGEREVTKGLFGFRDFWWNEGEPWQRRHEEMLRDMKERAGELRDRAEERLRDRREQRRPNPETGRSEPGKFPAVKHSTWVENGLILNLVESGGSKRLTVEKNGEKVFEGPVDTEEQRQKVPQEYREKLDKMDAAGTAPKGKPEGNRGENIL